MERKLKEQRLKEQRQNGPGIIWPSFKVGAASGAAGLLVGGTTSILSASKTPLLWTAAGGIQWSLLGSSYWLMRSATLQSRPQDEITPDTKAYVSASSAAASAAMVGGLLRGRSSVLPGLFFGALAGYGGQRGYDMLDQQNSEKVADEKMVEMGEKPRAPENEEPLWKRILDMKYSPITVLSNEDYKKVLEGRVLKMDVEISILDDDIRKLKGESAGSEELRSTEKEASTMAETISQPRSRREG